MERGGGGRGGREKEREEGEGSRDLAEAPLHWPGAPGGEPGPFPGTPLRHVGARLRQSRHRPHRWDHPTSQVVTGTSGSRLLLLVATLESRCLGLPTEFLTIEAQGAAEGGSRGGTRLGGEEPPGHWLLKPRGPAALGCFLLRFGAVGTDSEPRRGGALWKEIAFSSPRAWEIKVKTETP